MPVDEKLEWKCTDCAAVVVVPMREHSKDLPPSQWLVVQASFADAKYSGHVATERKELCEDCATVVREALGL